MIRIFTSEYKDLSILQHLEWLITNGIGCYASGTVSNMLTRSYHGYLIPALDPPVERRLFLTKLEEEVHLSSGVIELNCNQWQKEKFADCPGINYISGFVQGKDFCYWDYKIFDGVLRKTLYLPKNTHLLRVRYSWMGSDSTVALKIKILINQRDIHNVTREGNFTAGVSRQDRYLEISYLDSQHRIFVDIGKAEFSSDQEWYRNYFLAREHDRGLETVDSHLKVGQLIFDLLPSEEIDFNFTTDATDTLYNLIDTYPFPDVSFENDGSFVAQLDQAASQFIVKRSTAEDIDGKSIIAGYHWFADWGRDTMISLPGLALATDQFRLAEKILRTYVRFVDQGMIPNRFPDAGDQPEYNTVDATLWLFVAVDAYLRKTHDVQFLEDIYPILKSIIEWHVRGTRYKIKMDPEDGLLYAGEDGVQLTWMDAKVGEWVVTPRIGKPVEVNVLWYRAIRLMERLSPGFGVVSRIYDEIATKIKRNFKKFWNSEIGYCYDVIDGPGGNETSLRPNQLFVVSLTDDLLTAEQRKFIVDVCTQELLTPVGLRSLSPGDPKYVGRYGGDVRTRDGAYHQGTVWAWLIGPYLSAHWKVYRDKPFVVDKIKNFESELYRHGLGSVSEIYDGDPPHEPRGTIAQAWSVAELLRVIDEIGLREYL